MLKAEISSDVPDFAPIEDEPERGKLNSSKNPKVDNFAQAVKLIDVNNCYEEM